MASLLRENPQEVHGNKHSKAFASFLHCVSPRVSVYRVSDALLLPPNTLHCCAEKQVREAWVPTSHFRPPLHNVTVATSYGWGLRCVVNA